MTTFHRFFCLSPERKKLFTMDCYFRANLSPGHVHSTNIYCGNHGVYQNTVIYS